MTIPEAVDLKIAKLRKLQQETVTPGHRLFYDLMPRPRTTGYKSIGTANVRVQDFERKLRAWKAIKPGHCYFLRSRDLIAEYEGRHVWKIGLTRNPKARVLNVSKITGIKFDQIHLVATDYPHHLEHFLHIEFTAHRKWREFFDLDEIMDDGDPNGPKRWLKIDRHNFGVEDEIMKLCIEVEPIIDDVLNNPTSYGLFPKPPEPNRPIPQATVNRNPHLMNATHVG